MDSKFSSYPLYPSSGLGNFLVSSVAHNSQRNLWSQIQFFLCPTTHHNHFCSGLASPILGKSGSCSPRVPDGKERNICSDLNLLTMLAPFQSVAYYRHSFPGLFPSPSLSPSHNCSAPTREAVFSHYLHHKPCYTHYFEIHRWPIAALFHHLLPWAISLTVQPWGLRVKKQF